MAQSGLGVGILLALVLQYEVSGFVYKSLDPQGYRELHVMMREGGQMPLFTKKVFGAFPRGSSRERGASFARELKKQLSL